MQGKNILLGICGGIAAYKASTLVRLLKKAGAQVQVILTDEAHAFVTPLTLATLSGRPVLTRLYEPDTGEWNNHVDLGLWADLFVIAPATAGTLAKAAHGLSDSLLLTTYLSARCPVLWCPAMDLDMLAHPATQANLQTLRSFGNHVMEPAEGELASGLSGKGRLPEPEEIMEEIRCSMLDVRDSDNAISSPRASSIEHRTSELQGKSILITAGPTHEPLDPVRFIGNHSSGKMGFALAAEAARRGANVHLILGPTQLPPPRHPRITVHPVQTAEDMLAACRREGDANVLIFAAAVADYRAALVSPEKIKKNDPEMSLALVKNVDVAAVLGREKRKGQVLVGFALESSPDVKLAKEKLERKNLNLIAFNSLSHGRPVFGADDNQITLVHRTGQVQELGHATKNELAALILNEVEKLLDPMVPSV